MIRNFRIYILTLCLVIIGTSCGKIETPLHDVCLENYSMKINANKIIKMIEAGEDVNRLDEENRTFLEVCLNQVNSISGVQEPYYRGIIPLFKKAISINVDLINMDSKYPSLIYRDIFERISESSSDELFVLLLKNGAKYDDDLWVNNDERVVKSLPNAVSPDTLRTFLEYSNVDINALNDSGLPALYYSSEDNVEVFIASDADVNLSNNQYGLTPIFSRQGWTKVSYETLVKNGANINHQDVNGDTILIRELKRMKSPRSRKKHITRAKEFLSLGAEFSIPNNDGVYPIHLAAKSCVRELVDKFSKTEGIEKKLVSIDQNENLIISNSKYPIYNYKSLYQKFCKETM